MGYSLFALFLEIEKQFIFQKYFWDGVNAIEVGESQKEVNGKKITSYKIEQHRLPKSFDESNLNSYLSLANEYELICSY